ncbi:alpha/beta fold hydrolase [Chryseolinea lacunae]|uniref:Alpha/beta hydrolase n=1 Tax=Chryseolinea lacunae TaxID=2801331 RepID=A0ABS1KZ45_9BACT|nr:alpha/beta hydrolase [Chryseolinea lacunae]MBL0744548.1 alpha/beta hydrolase [Chryseolinea lacunae]
MTSAFFPYETTTLHYTVSGHGPEPLLLFHGFGQDHRAFATHLEVLASHYTVYAFDLYFHGQSKWGLGEQPLTKPYWKKILQAFLDQQRLTRFSLGGFSLGGKFVLATLEAFPEKINAVFLMAPDGVKTSFWYSLATYPVMFRRFFKSMIVHPSRFTTLTRTFLTLGVVDKGLLRFAEHQMNTPEKRQQVYCSWVVFRDLRFNLRHIASLVNTHNISFTLTSGKYDKVIRPANMHRLLRHVKTHRFEVLECGHNALVRESIHYFLRA